jgi:hypothetical protein
MGPFMSANTRRLQAPKIDEEVGKKKDFFLMKPSQSYINQSTQKKEKKGRIQETK